MTSTVPNWEDLPSYPTSFILTDDILEGSANKYARFAASASGKLSSHVTPSAGTSQLTWSGTFTANILSVAGGNSSN